MRAVVLVVAVALTSCSCGASQRPSTPATPAELVIENRRAEPIYVLSQADCSFLAWSIRGADGSRVGLDSGQSFACAHAAEGPCEDVGGCAGAGVVRIEPGESHTGTWDGTQAESARVDDPGENCPNDCVEWRSAPAGSYIVAVEAFGACEGECTCELAGADGECHRFDGLPEQTDLSAEARFALPASGPVTIAFE